VADVHTVTANCPSVGGGGGTPEPFTRRMMTEQYCMPRRCDNEFHKFRWCCCKYTGKGGKHIFGSKHKKAKKALKHRPVIDMER
jgi:hypothetical protein